MNPHTREILSIIEKHVTDLSVLMISPAALTVHSMEYREGYQAAMSHMLSFLARSRAAGVDNPSARA